MYSGRGRPPGSTNFPPAPEITKGSRVELIWDRSTYEAVVLTMGTKDKDGQARVHWASPGLEPGDGDKKEWKALDDLRPTPPDPPKGWLHRLQPFDVVHRQSHYGCQFNENEILVLPRSMWATCVCM